MPHTASCLYRLRVSFRVVVRVVVRIDSPVCAADRVLLDCFLAHLTATQTCAEAFDQFYRKFVVEQHYGNACR